MPMELSRIWTDISLLLLLGTANTMPIVAWHIFKDRFSLPVDFERKFFDERPIFGPHKTWRGIFSSLIGTWAAAMILGIGQLNGLLLAFWSMVGDLLASFIKRRLGLRSGAKCTGVDQII